MEMGIYFPTQKKRGGVGEYNYLFSDPDQYGIVSIQLPHVPRLPVI